MGRRTATRKSIYDPVHGGITLEGAPLELIGQPAFQRLWGIRQTGFAHLVFPGANHTRLEHSLGVYWVAGRMAEALELSPAEAETVAVGGLLHDLGHGPFSHNLDGPMHEVLGYGHERISRRWITEGHPGEGAPPPGPGPTIPAVLERHGIAPARVADLVEGVATRPGHTLLPAMLHGPIDADRLDYLQRDAHYTGVAHGAVDAARLLDTLESDRGRMVFAEKGRSAIEGFLLGRALMYSAVYYHKTVRAAEVMLASAVERLEDYPEAARVLFHLTDGDLLARLDRAGGRPQEMARAIRERRLFKRLARVPVRPSSARRFRGLLDPASRRSAEDAIAQRLGAAPGEVLLDTAGLAPPSAGLADLQQILLRDGARLARPFAESGPWRALLTRPPLAEGVSVYVHPRRRSLPAPRAARALERAL